MTILMISAIRQISERLSINHAQSAIVLCAYGRSLCFAALLLTDDDEKLSLLRDYQIFCETPSRSLERCLGLGADGVVAAIKDLADRGLVERDGLALTAQTGLFGEAGRGPFGAAIGSILEPTLGLNTVAPLDLPSGAARRDARLELQHELAIAKDAIAALSLAVEETGSVTQALYLLALLELDGGGSPDRRRGVPARELSTLVGPTGGNGFAALHALKCADLVRLDAGAAWRLSRQPRTESLRRRLEAVGHSAKPDLPPSMTIRRRLRVSS